MDETKPITETVQPLPMGCTIRDIRSGNGTRSHIVFARLHGPDGTLLITATLDYICRRIEMSGTKE